MCSGRQLSHQQAEVILRRLDLNGDGGIDLEEFLDWFARFANHKSNSSIKELAETLFDKIKDTSVDPVCYCKPGWGHGQQNELAILVWGRSWVGVCSGLGPNVGYFSLLFLVSHHSGSTKSVVDFVFTVVF